MNGDGHLDIVNSAIDDGEVGVRLGRGDGTFGPRVAYDDGAGTIAFFTVADFDGDGALEIAGENQDGLYAIRPSVWPKPVHQVLSDPASGHVVVEPETTGTTWVHQAAQDVVQVGVRVTFEADAPPAGIATIRFVAPDTRQLELGAIGDFSPAPAQSGRWRATVGVSRRNNPGLDGLNGLQPRGEWRLFVDNATDENIEVRDLRVITRGRLVGPMRGDRADQPIRIPAVDGVTRQIVSGSTTGLRDDAVLSCGVTRGTPDQFHELVVSEPASLTLNLVSNFDSVLELRDGPCDSEPLGDPRCDDDGAYGLSSRIADAPREAGIHCIVVDGFQGARRSSGDYRLLIERAPLP